MSFRLESKKSGFFQQRRSKQSKDWMWSLIRDSIEEKLKSHPELATLLPQLEELVINETKTPQAAASEIIEKFF